MADVVAELRWPPAEQADSGGHANSIGYSLTGVGFGIRHPYEASAGDMPAEATALVWLRTYDRRKFTPYGGWPERQHPNRRRRAAGDWLARRRPSHRRLAAESYRKSRGAVARSAAQWMGQHSSGYLPSSTSRPRPHRSKAQARRRSQAAWSSSYLLLSRQTDHDGEINASSGGPA